MVNNPVHQLYVFYFNIQLNLNSSKSPDLQSQLSHLNFEAPESGFLNVYRNISCHKNAVVQHYTIVYVFLCCLKYKTRK